MADIAVLGTVGVPAKYGGFETLVDNLVRYHSRQSLPHNLSIYCSSRSYESKPVSYHSASLIYLPFKANGIQSIIYDAVSIINSIRRRNDAVLLLGVSGAIILPLFRLLSNGKLVTNIDGIEWRRAKWTGLAKAYLRFSEAMAVKYSHVVVADNEAIADYVRSTYGKSCLVIAYGGDHATDEHSFDEREIKLPESFALGLCRIEPENNISMILEAFSKMPNESLVFVGNWSDSKYGRDLYSSYSTYDNLHLMDPVYDPGTLRHIRSSASAYIHGHSAGGTNPALVEMMHFGIPIFAHGCIFNRFTTEGNAIYFDSIQDLITQFKQLKPTVVVDVGRKMKEIAQRRYTWKEVGRLYFEALLE